MDGSLDIMEGSLLSISLLLNGWYPCLYGSKSIVDIFGTPMDGSLVIMKGSLLSRSFYSMDGSLVIMQGSLL